MQGSPEDVALAISSAPPAQRHVCGFLEGRAAVVLRADAGDADVAAACAHALLLHRRELVLVWIACLTWACQYGNKCCEGSHMDLYAPPADPCACIG